MTRSGGTGRRSRVEPEGIGVILSFVDAGGHAAVGDDVGRLRRAQRLTVDRAETLGRSGGNFYVLGLHAVGCSRSLRFSFRDLEGVDGNGLGLRGRDQGKETCAKSPGRVRNRRLGIVTGGGDFVSTGRIVRLLVLGDRGSKSRFGGGVSGGGLGTRSLFCGGSGSGGSFGGELLFVEVANNAGDVGFGFVVRRDAVVLLDALWSGVVGGEGFDEIEIVALKQFAKVAGSTLDVGLRVEGILHAERRGGLRHELHESLSAFRRDGADIEAAFGADDAGDEIGIEIVGAAGVAHGLIEIEDVRGGGCKLGLRS